MTLFICLFLYHPNDKLGVDSDIRRCIKYRNRRRSIALRKQTPSSWQKYKHLRNKTKQKLKEICKKQHFFENIESNIEQNRLNNSRNYWKSFKCLMGNYKQLGLIPIYLPIMSNPCWGPRPILKQTVNNVDEFYFTDEEKTNCRNN